jgi:predicted nucleic acid-binding protein
MTRAVSTPDPALIDTDVASVLNRSRLFQRVVPAELAQVNTEKFAVVELDQEIAVEYGRLRAATESLGRPVASNDLWIAAAAVANGLPLVTLNRRHFEPLTLHGLALL